jgi:hypothetical protein
MMGPGGHAQHVEPCSNATRAEPLDVSAPLNRHFCPKGPFR